MALNTIVQRTRSVSLPSSTHYKTKQHQQRFYGNIATRDGGYKARVIRSVTQHISSIPKTHFEYADFIWLVSPQFSCGDTCQLWIRLQESDVHLCKIENFANERSFSNRHSKYLIRAVVRDMQFWINHWVHTWSTLSGMSIMGSTWQRPYSNYSCAQYWLGILLNHLSKLDTGDSSSFESITVC